MKIEDILENEVLIEDIMLSPMTLSKLDNLVKFTILPLFIDELNLTKQESRQATIYLQTKIIEILSRGKNRVR